MRKYLLAAIGAVFLLAPVGAALAQLGDSRDGRNRWVRINNNSNYDVMAVYAVPSRWRRSRISSRDLIPADVIGRGQYLDVNFDLGTRDCVIDIRAPGSNGRDWIKRGLNVCVESDWNLVN